MSRRICLIVSGHLSTCPRMLKATDALVDAGYGVSVISTSIVDWGAKADLEIRRVRPNLRWTELRSPAGRAGRMRRALTHRVARSVVRRIGPRRAPLALAARAYGRFHGELLAAALAERVDLYYGGTATTQLAVATAARRMGVPYAIDLEDFHSGEGEDDAEGGLSDALATRIERAVLPGATFLTASSWPIADAYSAAYDVRPIVVHNVFRLPSVAPPLEPSTGHGLKICWFSQTVGPGRGLEDAIAAVGVAGLSGELSLRGRPVTGYLDRLRHFAQTHAPQLAIVHAPPCAPDELIAHCRGFDVGLALERDVPRNHGLALSNKALSYPLAGLALALTDTAGQRPLARELGEGALTVAVGDVPSLAAGLRRWAADRQLLGRAKAAAWHAGQRRWHWDHPSEREALLAAVATAVGR